MITDTILYGELPAESYISFPCKFLGEKHCYENGQDYRVKKKCRKQHADAPNTWLPVYRCELYTLCSPFGNNVDSQLIRPCEHCEGYERKKEPANVRPFNR